MTALATAPFRIDYGPSATMDAATLVAGFRAGIRGDVIAPGDPGYDAARAIRNLGFDRRPAAIVRPLDGIDVARAIVGARSAGFDLAVKGGGHSIAGHSVIDDGVVIDLARMRDIEIDPDARIAWVGGGATAGEVTAAAHEHGLAVPFGDTASVGVGGLTLGGGVGYLARKHGLTIDNLVAVELVTADGDQVTASADENPDLFWALRGGGGNFGVATRFAYRLVEAGMVTGGALFFDGNAATLASLMALADAAPDALTMIADTMFCPPIPVVPEEFHGRLVTIALVVHAGDRADGEAAMAPFRAVGPLVDLVGPMPYPAIYAFGEGAEQPAHEVVRTTFRDDFDASTAETVFDFLARPSSPGVLVQTRVLGGAVARVPAEATAFAHRATTVQITIINGHDGIDEAPHAAWATDLAAAITPAGAGAYVNFLGDEGEARIRAAYPGTTYERLVAVKRRWDPSNVFRSTQNIRPI